MRLRLRRGRVVFGVTLLGIPTYAIIREASFMCIDSVPSYWWVFGMVNGKVIRSGVNHTA